MIDFTPICPHCRTKEHMIESGIKPVNGEMSLFKLITLPSGVETNVFHGNPWKAYIIYWCTKCMWLQTVNVELDMVIKRR